MRPIATFTNDQLTIVQQSPIVANRLSSAISFQQPLLVGVANTPGAPGGSTCFYPGTLWTKTVNGLDCLDVFTAVIPWTQSVFCGFVKDTNVSTVAKTVLKTTLVHSYSETYHTSNGQMLLRQLSTSYLISVSFVVQKAFSSDTFAVTIPDPTTAGFVQVMVLGDAIYDVASGNTIVQFRTTAAWPYSLDTTSPSFGGVLPAIAGIDGTDVSIAEVDDGMIVCDTTQDSDCTQHWVVTISAPAGLCNIMGQYSFSDTLLCRDGNSTDAQTCVGGTPSPVTFSLNVRATDLCAPEVLDTSAANTYTLTPFFAPQDTDPTFSYQTGDMIYWQLTVVDPLVTIDSVTFSSVLMYVSSTEGSAQNDLLYSGSTTTVKGSNVGLTLVESNTVVPPGQPAVLTFSYQLLRSALDQTIAQLSASAGDAGLSVEVTTAVTVNIFYHGNQKRSVTTHVNEKSTTASQSRTVQLIIAPDVAEGVTAIAPKQPSAQAGSIFDDLSSSASTVRSFIGLFVAIFVAIALKF